MKININAINNVINNFFDFFFCYTLTIDFVKPNILSWNFSI